MKSMLEAAAAEQGWQWVVDLVPDPDALLMETAACVSTADSVVLDRADRWFNLARRAIDAGVPEAWIADLTSPDGS